MVGVVYVKPEKHNTYCDYPFKQITLKNWNKNKLLEYTPCCMMMDYGNNMMQWKDASDLDPKEAFESVRFDRLRNDLKSGVKNGSCKTCWNLEREGITSPRLYSMEHDDESTFELRQLDLSISNKCNLMCRMCNYGNSHKFLKEINFFKKNNLLDRVKKVTSDYYVEKTFMPNSLSSKQFDWLMNNTEKIKILKISGGEPFYDDNIIKLLSKYISDNTAKNTILQFNTNGTLFNDKTLNLHKQFKSIDHYISVDGVDQMYDYIRYPYTFKKFNNSILNYVNLPNILALRFACVISSLNILNMDEWLFHMLSLSGRHKYYFNFQKVRPFDRGISINLLPIQLLEESKDRLLNNDYSNFYSHRFFDDCKSLIEIIDGAIKHNKCNRKKMLEEITLFDKSRKQNYENYLDVKLVDWLKNE